MRHIDYVVYTVKNRVLCNTLFLTVYRALVHESLFLGIVYLLGLIWTHIGTGHPAAPLITCGVVTLHPLVTILAHLPVISHPLLMNMAVTTDHDQGHDPRLVGC